MLFCFSCLDYAAVLQAGNRGLKTEDKKQPLTLSNRISLTVFVTFACQEADSYSDNIFYILMSVYLCVNSFSEY